MKEKLLKQLATSRQHVVDEMAKLTDVLAVIDYEIECINLKNE